MSVESSLYCEWWRSSARNRSELRTIISLNDLQAGGFDSTLLFSNLPPMLQGDYGSQGLGFVDFALVVTLSAYEVLLTSN